MPQGCSEPRPHQAKIGIADEVLTILAEAALENQQIDKAMEANRHSAESKERKGCRCVATRGIMSVHNGTVASSATRDLGRNFEVEPAEREK